MLNRNPGVAAVLSFFVAGLGQIYNGQIWKGLLIMGVQAVNLLLTTVIIGFITGLIVWVWAIFDAYNTAKKHNEKNSAIGPRTIERLEATEDAADN